jgi:hypothetical protein
MYLYHEFAVKGHENRVSASWPFKLREISSLVKRRSNARLFVFNDSRDTYLVEAGHSYSFWIAGGMSIEDLRLHTLGTEWISEHRPVDLDTPMPTDLGIPSVIERYQAIQEIALHTVDRIGHVQILEGLFFPGEEHYLALVEDLATGRRLIVGSGIAPQRVKHSDQAPWRQLYMAIGEMLQNGELNA